MTGQAVPSGVINENAIFDELNQGKADRNADQGRMAELKKYKKTLAEVQKKAE